LKAPRGTINAGAAGVRVSGNLNIVVLQVLNAFNIQVQGVTVGIPGTTAPNIGALSDASAASGAATKAITSTGQGNNNNAQPSILIVEIEGYGGDDDEPVQEPQPDQRKRTDGQHASYDPYSPVHLLGNGQLTDRQERKLDPDERDRLDRLVN
jgi:Filamentous haemagglutinin family outer membrane protein